MNIKDISKFFLDKDQKILDYIESICHKQQRFFGVTHYFWLKLDAIILSIFYFVFIYPNIDLDNKWKTNILIGVLIFFGFFGYDIWEKSSYNRIVKGLGNPLRNYDYFVFFRWTHIYIPYLYFLLTAIIILFFDFSSFFFFTIFFVVYVAFTLLYLLPACDPLPPCNGKIQTILKNLIKNKSVPQSI